MKNPFDSDDYKVWADDMRQRLIPKMRDSEHVLLLAPDLSADFDIDFAVQIGAMILMEKPLVVVVDYNRVCPPKLLKVADKIIRVDLRTVTPAEVQEQVRQALAELGRQ